MANNTKVQRNNKVKENMKKYRKKIYLNSQLKAEYLKRTRENSKRYRDKIKKRTSASGDLLEIQRKKENERKRKYRQKLKEKESIQSQKENILPPYKTSQSLGKDVKKIRMVLPQSKDKKIAALSKILLSIDPNLKITSANELDNNFPIVVPNTWNKLVPEAVEKINRFYCREDISRVSPAIKDKIKIKTSQGTEYEQKRHMMFTIKEAFNIFVNENPNIKVKLSKFYELRPCFVLPSSEMPHNVCVCMYHANIFYIIDVLSKNIPLFPKTHTDLVKELCCNVQLEACMMGECIECQTVDLEFSVLPISYNRNKVVTISQWVLQNEKMQIVVLNESLQSASKMLQLKIPQFKKHCLIKSTQQKYFDAKRAAIQENEITLQMDFAENFALIAQDEIQTAHWNHSQVTVFTAVAWLSNKVVYSFSIVSNYLSHDKYSVYFFLKQIIFFIKEKHAIQKLYIFTDGCAAQFKNRFTLSTICFLPQELQLDYIEWNFFATSHGKGAVDGVGATVKRKVWTEIKSRKSTIKDAHDFYECAKKLDKVQVLFVSDKEIENIKAFLNDKWKSVKALPNIKSSHYFKYINKNSIEIRTTVDSNKLVIFQCFSV